MSSGEQKKTIEIVIKDDFEPEDNESLMIGLVNTEGGSRILPSSDTVTIVIVANDNVAGMLGFHPASRSIIAREGELLISMIWPISKVGKWRIVMSAGALVAVLSLELVIH